MMRMVKFFLIFVVFFGVCIFLIRDMISLAQFGKAYAKTKLLVGDSVGINIESDSNSDLEINNTLVLAPVAESSYEEEGAFYYDNDEDVIKFYDGSNWKVVGEIQPADTKIVTRSLVEDSDNEIECPEGYIVSEIRIETGARGCPLSCNFYAGSINKVTLICQSFQ